MERYYIYLILPLYIKEIMHITTQQEIINTYQTFIHASGQNVSKVIIDINGLIHLSGEANTALPLIEGALLSSIFPNYVLDLSSKRLGKTAQAGKESSQYIHRSNNGVDYWYQMLITPIGDTEAPMFIVQLIDITRFKKIEKETIRRRKRIETEMTLRTNEIVQTNEQVQKYGGFFSNFMRGLRHDLLSPIAQLKEIISFYIKTDDPIKKEKAAIYIDDCIQKLSNTANGFSEFVDLYILPHLSVETVSIEEILNEIKLVLIDEINQSKARIVCDFDKSESLYFNKKIMSSIVYNLLSNAIKFRRQNVELIITVQAYQRDNDFVFSIEDNGVGIDIEKYGHLLFKPFKRLNMDVPGVGVGLSMIKNFLIRYEGDIQIRSQPNKGTTVLVQLPLVQNAKNTN